MGKLDNKVAVITGGASGIGLASAACFLKHGASVVIGDANSANGEQALSQMSAQGFGERVRFAEIDVANEADVEALIQMSIGEFKGLDIIFNNAGIGGALGPITEIDAGDWDYTFAVMTKGVFLGVKHAAKRLIDQGRGGSIINTASVAALHPGAGPVAYSAAKSSVVSLTKNSARELAPHRIRVNCICPGMIYTPLMHRGDEQSAEQNMRRIQPWPDRGEGRHIASAALYLASDDAEFITGEALVVDGGYSTTGGGGLDNPIDITQKKYAGITYGTTGKAPAVRRLTE